ncbi:MAG: amidase [Pseudomonadota bacterium]
MALPRDGTADQFSMSGIRVGIKDVIDVAGLPTRNGSEAYRDAPPADQDAPVVAALRNAGASIIGKTTTTEFAFTDATNCRNPYDINRTPGGSSSGSGAAVAAGMVDLALGTQTAGSLIRPASYCGAVGLKPTYGLLPTIGVTPLALSFDTVGLIARSIEIATRGFAAMTCGAGTVTETKDVSAYSGLLQSAAQVDPETLQAFHEGSRRLGEIASMFESGELTVPVNDIVTSHRNVMNFEAFRAHGHLLRDDTVRLLRPKFSAGLRLGGNVSPDEYDFASICLADTRREFWERFGNFDIIITLAVPDGAPLIGETTGFQDWLTVWTVFGGPLISLPWGLDSLGRPKSVMLAGRPNEDWRLLHVAEKLQKLAPVMPGPQLPSI